MIDGWDLYRSDSIIIQNSVVSNDDDCVSFKPNSTNIVVQNMHCTNSHGISVGSLGQYVGEVDLAGMYPCHHLSLHTPFPCSRDISLLRRQVADFITENLYIYNATMTTGGDAARIKVYGGNIPANNSTTSGGGTGLVRNVTYDTIFDEGCDCKLSSSCSLESRIC